MADELILTLDFETPPRADEVGELFSALARDYRDMTKGRVLVVVRVKSGSIVATLTDFALAAAPYVRDGIETVVAINALTKFAKNLKEWFGRAKSDEGKKRLYRKGKKAPGQRSVEAIIKTAANAGGCVRVKHTTEKGETLEVEFTSGEAIKAREQAPVEPTKVVRHERSLVAAPEVQAVIDRLHHAGGRNLSPTEVQALVEVLVTILQASDAGHLLPKIASDLESRGLHDFASVVRQHVRSSGKREPPLTTT